MSKDYFVSKYISVFLYQLPFTAAKCYWVVVRVEEQLTNTKYSKHQAVHAVSEWSEARNKLHNLFLNKHSTSYAGPLLRQLLFHGLVIQH